MDAEGIAIQLKCNNKCNIDGKDTTTVVADRARAVTKLSLAIGFCVIFMIGEVIGGVLSNSLAILTDAAHLLSDIAGFAIALFAIYASGWEANPRQTFGYYRLEILGALISIQIIWLVTGVLVYEAILRFIHPDKNIDGLIMFAVACGGLGVNIIVMYTLGHEGHHHAHGHNHGDGHEHNHNHSHEVVNAGRNGNHKSHKHEDGEDNEVPEISIIRHESLDNPGHRTRSIKLNKDLHSHKKKKKENINIRAAYLHALGDFVQSIGVMIAGAMIWYKPGLYIVDPICTVLFSIMVLATTYNMIREIVSVLMESTPREIDASALEAGLLKLNGVVAVHELHIWAITVGRSLLACHIQAEPQADTNEVLHVVTEYVEKVYNISHVTIQVEQGLC